MPAPIFSATKSGKMTGMVTVDASDVFQVISRVEQAVSPHQLHVFLRGPVSHYFENKIIDLFASLGGGGVAGGAWPPLSEGTKRIRHALGYYDDYAINERTGELLDYVAFSRQFSPLPDGASMTLPDGQAGTELERKLRTAQEGRTQGSGEMLPGAYTPPRPVLQPLDEEDLLMVTRMLQVFIMQFVGKMSP